MKKDGSFFLPLVEGFETSGCEDLLDDHEGRTTAGWLACSLQLGNLLILDLDPNLNQVDWLDETSGCHSGQTTQNEGKGSVQDLRRSAFLGSSGLGWGRSWGGSLYLGGGSGGLILGHCGRFYAKVFDIYCFLK